MPIPASRRWLRSPGSTSRSTPTISASCSARGSMPAAGSAPPISARACSRPTIRRSPPNLARRLDAYNRERREIEARTLEAAIAMVEGVAQSPVLVFAAAEDWHPGVIGIVAARLKERYERPACVVALADGIGKGSGRSVAGLPLGPAVIAARQAGLLINGGGHAMAAGFTVAAEKLDALREFLVERLGDGLDRERLVPELQIDGALSLAAAQAELIEPYRAAGAVRRRQPGAALRLSRRAGRRMPSRSGAGICAAPWPIRSTRPGCGRSPSAPPRRRSASSSPRRAASRSISPAICAATAGAAAMRCSSRSTTPHRQFPELAYPPRGGHHDSPAEGSRVAPWV